MSAVHTFDPGDGSLPPRSRVYVSLTIGLRDTALPPGTHRWSVTLRDEDQGDPRLAAVLDYMRALSDRALAEYDATGGGAFGPLGL